MYINLQLREREVIRLCLKYFRQKNYLEPFEALRAVSKVFVASVIHFIIFLLKDHQF
jgi:hypothetical protein